MLGLWNYPAASNALELSIFIFGIIFYIKPLNTGLRKPRPVLFFGTLLIVYHFINGLVPPPAGMSTNALAISVLIGILVFSCFAEILDRRFYSSVK